MISFKHFSFDLWFTLIKSNPNFKKEKALYFFKNYNSKNKSLFEVEDILRRVDLLCNSINEKTGGNITSEEMHLLVIHELNNERDLFESIDLNDLYKNLEELFFSNQPVVFSNSTIDVLDKIRQIPDISMSVLSNTAYIKGSTLRKLLHSLDISKYFDFQIYSDEVKSSKPNPKIFKELINCIQSHRYDKPIEYDKIIHIGDSVTADINGARLMGIESMLINSNGKNIESIFGL
jgi:putative hydrolase of the HAD superfamily